jgi:phosphatidylinositol 3,5-bisphosphate 5-phosphatase
MFCLMLLVYITEENLYFSKSTNALQVLLKVAFEALNLTEFFYRQVSPAQRAENSPNLSPTL